MPDPDWSAYRQQAFKQFRDQHPDLPGAWFEAIAQALAEGRDGHEAVQFDFGDSAYLDDERFLQILTVDPHFGEEPEEGNPVHLFALWRMADVPLDHCPVIQSTQIQNGDGTCSPTCSQEAVAQDLNAFLRLMATGVVGRDEDTLEPIAIDPAPFQRVASPLASVADAEQAMETAAQTFAERLPAPLGWHLED